MLSLPLGARRVRARGCVNRFRAGYPVIVRKIIGGFAAVAALAAVAGCGAADAPDAEAAARRFVTAAERGAADEVCALLAPRARDAVGPQGCGPVLAAFPHAPIESAAAWGDEAQARSAADTLFLHDFPDGWRVTGAGCHPRNDQVYDCSVGGR